MLFRLALLTTLLTLLTTPAVAGSAPRWTPQIDGVYDQEVGRQIPTDKPVRAVAVFNGVLYAGFGDGVRHWHGSDGWQTDADAPATTVRWMKTLGETLFVGTQDALYGSSAGEHGTWNLLIDLLIEDAVETTHGLVFASPSALYTWDAAQRELRVMPGSEPAPGPIQKLAWHADTVYCLGYDRLFLFNGKHYEVEEVVEFGALPSKDLRDVLTLGSRLLVGCHQGIGVVRGTAATQVLAADGLPWEETRCLAEGFDQDYWVGTPQGAIRATGKAFHWLAGPRWLPSDSVADILVEGRTAYIATTKGIGIIDYQPFTLEQKADYYEAHLEAWGQKRGPFTHELKWTGEDTGWQREVSDNDVGWSVHYWAAQAFKYAATGDERSKQLAVDGFNVMKWAEEVSSIDGYPARSLWAVGETGIKASGGSGGYPAEWHPVPGGAWEWKGDTSSDEIDAHFYYATVFYELVANEKQKEEVRDHVGRIARHIVENGWTLTDVDGKPTVWGRWDPEYFRSPRGAYATGLNGLEILCIIRTAWAMTGDAYFEQAYQSLIDLGYHEYVMKQKHTHELLINHSDDRLAFFVYYPLLQYETDPYLRSLYRRSFERSYEIERIERAPWYTYIYGALTGNDIEHVEAVDHLRAWPLDLIKHPYDISTRRDLFPPPGYLPYADVLLPPSPREIGPVRWSHNAGPLQGGSGREVVDPAAWLDAYWMGRYYGFIAPPARPLPETGIKSPTGQLGAVPYDGPPFPDILDD